MKKRLTSLFLALLMLMPSAVSCSESASNTDDTAQTSDADTAPSVEDTVVEEEAEDSRATVKDGLPDDLDYNGRTFTIFYSNGFDWDSYIEGPEELTGEVVEDAVVTCNNTVSERLNIDLQYTHDDTGNYATIAGILTTMIMAGDTQNDIVMGDQYGIVQIATKGLFMNANEIEYLDFEQPWWNTDFIENLCIGNDKKFLLSGEYNLTMLNQIFMLYINKSIYENHFGTLDSLYGDVIEGNWTIDDMSRLVNDVYIDKNGNGTMDDEDQYGFIAYLTYSSVDPFMYCGDVQYYTRDADGYVTIDMNQERAVTLTEKVVSLFHQTGVNTNTEHDVGSLFMQDGSLLLSGLLSNAKNFREMESDFGFMPIPKLDETQDSYTSLVGDCNLLYAFPVTTQNSDMAGAVLEALNAETYRTVTPAWYEVALKVKYTRDNLTAQIIDIIRDSVDTSFIFAYSPLLSNCGQVMRDLVTNNNTDYASSVAKTKKVVDKMLGKLIEAYESDGE